MENSKIRNAVLFDCLGEKTLSPFLEGRAPGLLPLVGKPLIQFWCELLSNAGINKLHLVLRHFPEQVRELVGQGERWGLSISISTLPDSTNYVNQIFEVKGHLQGHCLVGNVLHLPVYPLQEVLDLSVETLNQVQPQTFPPLDSYLYVFNADVLKLETVSTKMAHVSAMTDRLMPLTTPKALWQANRDLLEAKIHDPLPGSMQADEGISLSPGVTIKPGYAFHPPCSIGKNSLIEERVKIGPFVSIGQNCIIGIFSEIKESVIFDNTYLGSDSFLNRVLADGRLIYHVDADLPVWINDPAILNTTLGQPMRVAMFDRFLALLLLFLTLPVSVAIVLKMIMAGRPLLLDLQLMMPNGRDLSGQHFHLSMPVSVFNVNAESRRRLPWLWQIIKGKMHLTGISPMIGNVPDFPDWAEQLQTELPGVINLFDVETSVNERSDESRWVADNFYLATVNMKLRMTMTLKWLLSLVNYRR